MASVWGRAKVRELEDRYAAGTDPNSSALAKQIVDISLATHVLSRFTAYVAVDRSEVVNRDGPLQEILQPVEMPRGWDMGVRTLTCLGSPRSAVAMTCYLDASCEHPAAPASAPVRSQPGVFRSLGERLFRKRSHSADQAHPPASSDMRQKCEAIADRLREAIDRVPNDRALVQRQKWLEQVITHLEVLLSLAGIPTQTETALKDVLQRARDLLAVHAGGDKDALGDAGFTSLVDSLRAALLGGPIEEQPRREFWK
jgi:hypothetical protein